MSIELVLKLTGHEPGNYFDLQRAWQDKRDGSFSEFDGRTIAGLTFHQRFQNPRGDDFPIDDLFRTIDSELDHGRFVIVSLRMESAYHMFVIVGRTPDGDYEAVSKAYEHTFEETDTKQEIRALKGTDIMTYTESPPMH